MIGMSLIVVVSEDAILGMSMAKSIDELFDDERMRKVCWRLNSLSSGME